MTGYWMDIGCNFQSDQMVWVAENMHFQKSNQQQEHSNYYKISPENGKKKRNFIWDGILTFIIKNLNYKFCKIPTINTEYATSIACRVSHSDGPTPLRHYKYTCNKDMLPYSLCVMHWRQHITCAETCSQDWIEVADVGRKQVHYYCYHDERVSYNWSLRNLFFISKKAHRSPLPG
jgi:hypothetical protein